MDESWCANRDIIINGLSLLISKVVKSLEDVPNLCTSRTLFSAGGGGVGINRGQSI